MRRSGHSWTRTFHRHRSPSDERRRAGYTDANEIHDPANGNSCYVFADEHNLAIDDDTPRSPSPSCRSTTRRWRRA